MAAVDAVKKAILECGCVCEGCGMLSVPCQRIVVSVSSKKIWTSVSCRWPRPMYEEKQKEPTFCLSPACNRP